MQLTIALLGAQGQRRYSTDKAHRSSIHWRSSSSWRIGRKKQSGVKAGFDRPFDFSVEQLHVIGETGSRARYDDPYVTKAVRHQCCGQMQLAREAAVEFSSTRRGAAAQIAQCVMILPKALMLGAQLMIPIAAGDGSPINVEPVCKGIAEQGGVTFRDPAVPFSASRKFQKAYVATLNNQVACKGLA